MRHLLEHNTPAEPLLAIAQFYVVHAPTHRLGCPFALTRGFLPRVSLSRGSAPLFTHALKHTPDEMELDYD